MSLNLCGYENKYDTLVLEGPKIYFDCMNTDGKMTSERTRKSVEESSYLVEYHEFGYNFTKPLLDIRDYVNEPFVFYEFQFGSGTRDSCDDNIDPKSLSFGGPNKVILMELRSLQASIDALATNSKR